MVYPTQPLTEHPSTYFVEDRSNQEEIDRLIAQDAMLTTGMGGVLPELPAVSGICSVLDVGCGTGGWLIEVAKTYPAIERLVGVDISRKVFTPACRQVHKHHLEKRIAFQTMDALRMLEFHTASFDLINQRLGVSWLRTWEWTKILLEYQRVTKTGGIIRITEPAMIASNSPALTTLCQLALDATYRSGRFFTKTSDGVIHRLVLLMTQHAIEDIQTRDSVLTYQAGTPEHHAFAQDMKQLFHVALPFLQKWTWVPTSYQHIYQQALREMQEPEFVATWHLLTAWGKATKQGKHLLMSLSSSR